MKDFSLPDLENSVIYELNVRQYSKEGNFKAFQNDLPILKELGVRILWIMPIQPISIKKRKADNGKFIEEIKEPKERKKVLGSPYAISNYCTINPEFGTIEDFKKLVESAHQIGIFVIIDWVADHTGWDHHWITKHPEFYHKDTAGKITEPLDSNGKPIGWNDVAHLNYENRDLWESMFEQMKFWLTETGIDGFRCDVADMVRLDFWKYATQKLRKIKPVFMLAESDHRNYLETAFNVGYDWKIHHIMNQIAKGEMSVIDFDEMIEWESKNYSKEISFMRFTSNHDENAWKGTEYDRLGDAAEIMTAITYMLPGLPLIYNGQEYDSKKQLKFFEKDLIEKERGKMFKIYKELGRLKNQNQSMNGGITKAAYQKINTSDSKNILAFYREKSGEKLYFIGNLSNQKNKFKLELEGAFENFIPGSIHLWEGIELEFAPWQYWILKEE